ncbi:hypothetical protein CYY_005113 [Polysphondylium violaceum]|uniref:palmitoyl-protein hydrolase n=1 Tax=Polysphondylium violaceum TaxID=133409 RepID=A0A8J4PVL8_9MYCE|nr:hypothetical protein CYY_005113 [Polysphondylium violaceum]
MSKEQIISVLPTEKHSATVIFLHGLMDTGSGWEGAIKMIRSQGGLEHVKFILPTAPIIPVSINFGMKGTAWFDITSLSPGGNEDIAGLDKSKKFIESIIQDEKTEYGIDSNRIILGGFSQGGALTLYTGYQLQEKLAGLIVLSGFVPSLSLPSKMREENKSTPMIMYHGTADQLLNFKFGEMSFNLLKTQGVNGTFHPVAGMGHSASEQELREVSQFIKSTLPK